MVIIHLFVLSGALEMGGEINSAALMEFQGHINKFQVSFSLFLIFISY